MSEPQPPEGMLGRVVDPLAAVPAWQPPQLATLLSRRDQAPHALLLSGGTPGVLTRVAEALAAGLLCDAPLPAGFACGACAACRLLAAGNHPDLLWLVPGQGDEAAGRKPSAWIRIESVRELIGMLALSPHHAARRVAVIEPAEAMNAATANALLKVLEEPPPGNLLLLISLRPMRLLPTIRSRCLQLRLSAPDFIGQAADASTPADPAARELAAFLRDPAPDSAALAVWPAQRVLLDALSRGASLSCATASRIAGLTLPAALDALARWLHDLARVQAGVAPRFLPLRREALARVAAVADPLGVLQMARRLGEWQRHARHPLLVPLTVADILLEYRAELFPPTRKAS